MLVNLCGFEITKIKIFYISKWFKHSFVNFSFVVVIKTVYFLLDLRIYKLKLSK